MTPQELSICANCHYPESGHRGIDKACPVAWHPTYRFEPNPVHAVGTGKYAELGKVFEKISDDTKDQTATFERCLSQVSKQEPS